VTLNPIRISSIGALSLLLSAGLMLTPLHAELSEAQKKELFRKSHSGSSSSSSSTKKKSSSSGSSSSSSKKKPSGTSAASSSKKHPSSSSTSSPKKRSSAQSSDSSKKSSSSSGTAHSVAPAIPSATPSPDRPSTASGNPAALPLPHGASPAAITIEKSGVEADQGLEPAPTPPPAPEGFWSRLFGSHKNYTYLSSSVRAAIDRAPVRKGRWKYIVVHNSGTREGNARVFDIYHRRVRHMQNGLAYHFVIGDGHGSSDGQIEIGDRWKRQINGGHVASDYLNDIALGICLVGDFNRDQPTKAQVGALEELVAYLRNRVGKSQGRQAIVHAHKEINPRPTDCPGDHFPYGWLHAKFGNER